MADAGKTGLEQSTDGLNRTYAVECAALLFKSFVQAPLFWDVVTQNRPPLPQRSIFSLAPLQVPRLHADEIATWTPKILRGVAGAKRQADRNSLLERDEEYFWRVVASLDNVADTDTACDVLETMIHFYRSYAILGSLASDIDLSTAGLIVDKMESVHMRHQERLEERPLASRLHHCFSSYYYKTGATQRAINEQQRAAESARRLGLGEAEIRGIEKCILCQTCELYERLPVPLKSAFLDEVDDIIKTIRSADRSSQPQGESSVVGHSQQILWALLVRAKVLIWAQDFSDEQFGTTLDESDKIIEDVVNNNTDVQHTFEVENAIRQFYRGLWHRFGRKDARAAQPFSKRFRETGRSFRGTGYCYLRLPKEIRSQTGADGGS